MTEKISLDLDSETMARLRRVAAASGDSLERVAAQALGDMAAELDDSLNGDWGDDAELLRRLEAWQASGESIPADEVHLWLKSLDTDAPTPPPKARRP